MSTAPPTPPDANLLRGHLDLILLSIIQGSPKYGLEISKLAQTATDGYFDLKVGSLYPALHRLEKAGFVRSEFTSGPRSGNQVKAYTLTESGGRELNTRRAEFQTFTQQLGKLWNLTGGMT
ncbi:PadR family transcriptional regulator (plasmid) [Deinococcus sp. D7000]|nr:PadR family transcriptional regulator [Deinococcus sp. D7000]